MSTSTIVLQKQQKRTASSSSTTTTAANRRRQRSPEAAPTKTTTSKATKASTKKEQESSSNDKKNPLVPLSSHETGSGTYQDPYRLPPTRAIPAAANLYNVTNKSGCYDCPSVDSKCDCLFFNKCLSEAIAEVNTKRITSQAGRLDLCAKSVMPCFMNRMVKLMDMMNFEASPEKKKTFFDFGSGNGSVLFYIAWVTGIDCVGVELSPHNTEHSKQLWAKLKPKLERRRSVIRQEYDQQNTSKKFELGNVTIICGDVCDFLREHLIVPNTPSALGKKNGTIRSQKPPSNHSSSSSSYDHQQITKLFTEPDNNQLYIWTANLLMPKSVTHFMAESFRQPYVPVGTKMMAFDDLYPHGRAVARVRDPEAFEIFEMVDFMWQLGSVEWTQHVEGMFHLYIKVQ